jgi:hypothetical protein
MLKAGRRGQTEGAVIFSAWAAGLSPDVSVSGTFPGSRSLATSGRRRASRSSSCAYRSRPACVRLRAPECEEFRCS